MATYVMLRKCGVPSGAIVTQNVYLQALPHIIEMSLELPVV